MKIQKIVLFAAVLIGLSSVASVQAREPVTKEPVAKETAAKEAVTQETVVVTANKTEENVQDVSTSLTVFTGDHVEDLRLENINDISTFTPNFIIYENGQAGANAPAMRGMFADLHSHSVAVGMYVDGVPILDGMGYEQALVDVERIEVLKGPQGTLYGKSAEAGIVNIITREPDNETRVPLSAELGTDGKIKATGTLSGSLVDDKVYASLSFLHDQKDGWVENSSGDTIDDIEKNYMAAKLRFTPMDDLDIVLGTTFLKYDNGQPHMNLTDMGAAMYGLSAPQDRVTNPSFDGYDKSETISHSLRVNYSLSENMALTSTTAYRKLSYDGGADFDFSEPEYLHFFNNNKLERLSEELRVSSVDTPVKWVVRFYADKDEVNEDWSISSIVPGMAMVVDDAVMEGRSWSAFGHVNYPLGDFSVLGGIRYDAQKKEFKQPSYAISLENDWSEVSPKFGVEYRITDETMTYATVSKGYLSGGFNAYAGEPGYISYDEEKLWSYEIGVKNSFFNNRLILNAAVFYMDISDAQIQESLNAATTYTTNAAEASSKGIEVEAIFTPIMGLTLNAGFGYTDAVFENFSDAAGDYEGNKKPFAPDYTFNIGATYRAASGWYYGANVTGASEMYSDKNNLYEQDAHVLVNAKLGYETDRFDIYVYGKNVFDEECNTTSVDGFYTVYNRPAEYGIMLTYRL